MIKNNILIFCIVSLFSFGHMSGLAKAKNEREKFTIANNAISVPAERFMLIKKDTKYAALKMIDVQKKAAKYEWYYQADGSGNFLSNNVKKGWGEVKDLYIPIIGRFALQLGQFKIVINSLTIEWSPTTWIYFTDQSGNDIGIEMAPTIYKSINEVNIFGKKLKWYKYDEHRENFDIYVDELE